MASFKLSDALWIGSIVFIAFCALFLRLWDIDVRSITHPEVYIPGINLVEGISEPPLRHDWKFSIWWHFHDEPHAIGYYLLMQIWTGIAGTSEFALRLPSAIMGAASVIIVAIIAAKCFGRRVAVVAALMLALHGFNIYWSQNARMYVPATLMGMISTAILIHLSQLKSRSLRWELAYIACAIAGALTFEFFWPFMFVQVGWIALVVSMNPNLGDEKLSLRKLWAGAPLAQIQAMAMMLSAPTLLHAVYRARKTSQEDPSFTFLQEYYSFGFLLMKDFDALPFLIPSSLIASAALLFTVLLVLFSVVSKVTLPTPTIAMSGLDVKPVPSWIRIVGALVMTVFMIWLATIAHRRNAILYAMALIPICTLALPGVMLLAALVLRQLSFLRTINPYVLLLILLGIAPTLVLFAISYVVPLLAPRAYLMFTPYLLILCAAGLRAVPGELLVQSGVAALTFAIFLYGVNFSYQKTGSPRDYKGLALAMSSEMREHDLVFVRYRNWADSPLFYYLPEANYVAENFEQAVNDNQGGRVWLVQWTENDRNALDSREVAVANLEELSKVTARRAEAILFEIPETELIQRVCSLGVCSLNKSLD